MRRRSRVDFAIATRLKAPAKPSDEGAEWKSRLAQVTPGLKDALAFGKPSDLIGPLKVKFSEAQRWRIKNPLMEPWPP